MDVVDAVAVVVEVGEREREEVEVGVCVGGLEAAGRAVTAPLPLGARVREGRRGVGVMKGEGLDVPTPPLVGVAGSVGDKEGEGEVVGVGKGATVVVPLGKGVPVFPFGGEAVTPHTPVPLGRPVARGVKERLAVGSIEGEEEEEGEVVGVLH